MPVLSPYRVLDLTTERGLLCGQMLGDMGADVIKVEPPGGCSARNIGPFFEDRPHPDRSLYWWAYNRSKRSITLDLERVRGREIFRKLVAKAVPGAVCALKWGQPVFDMYGPFAWVKASKNHDSLGFYRPRYQTRSELYVSTRLLDKIPSGNFGSAVTVNPRRVMDRLPLEPQNSRP